MKSILENIEGNKIKAKALSKQIKIIDFIAALLGPIGALIMGAEVIIFQI